MTALISREQAIKAVHATRQLHDKIAVFLNSQELEPKSDSLAARELQTFERPESLSTAYSQGTSLIEVAGDHLIGFTKTVTEPVQTIAPWTMTRAVLEASAMSCWLLDTSINSRLRVRRSLALRYVGFVQQAKFGQASGRFKEAAKVDLRIEEVEAIAVSIGFAKLRNDKGKLTGIGQVMPSVTEIIRDTLKAEAHYRLLSAMAHAHPWAFSQLSFRKSGETHFQKEKAFPMEKNIPLEAVLWLCSNVAKYFVQPIKCQCELYGLDSVKLRAILDEGFREMGIRPESGLWHDQH